MAFVPETLSAAITNVSNGPDLDIKEDMVDHAMKLRLAFVILITLLIPFIVVDSFLMIISTYLIPKLRSPDNLIIMSVAVADLLVALWVIPLYVIGYLRPLSRAFQFRGKLACLSWTASLGIAQGASLAHLLLLCLERFVAVNWPLQYHKIITKRRICRTLVVIWIVVIGCCIPLLFVMKVSNAEAVNPEVKCTVSLEIPGKYLEALVGVAIGLFLLFPFLLYLQICCAVVQQVRSREYCCYLEGLAVCDCRMIQVFCAASSMMVFILMWLPNAVVRPLIYYKAIELTPEQCEAAKLVAQLFSIANSVLNVPIYAVLCKPEYKRAHTIIMSHLPCEWGSLRKRASVSTERASMVEWGAMPVELMMIQLERNPSLRISLSGFQYFHPNVAQILGFMDHTDQTNPTDEVMRVSTMID